MQDPQGHALLDYDGTVGTIRNWYAFGSGSNDVLNQINVVGSTRATYIPDVQGSIIASLDASSGTLTKAGYQTYGESSTTAGTFRYTGARIDSETNGLYDFRARMYSPTLGRFMQTDPIGHSGGNNLYAYVNNDPLNGTDPLGLYTLQIGFAGSIGSGFVVPLGLGLVIDTSGHVGIYFYGGGGVQGGADVEAGLSIQVSNAKTISDISGPFLNASAHGGVGFGGSVDYFRGPSANGQVSGAGVTLGVAAGASVTGAYTTTSVYAPFGDGSTLAQPPTVTSSGTPPSNTSSGTSAQQVEADVPFTPNQNSFAGSTQPSPSIPPASGK